MPKPNNPPSATDAGMGKREMSTIVSLNDLGVIGAIQGECR
jgi:hypothetical protein